MSFMNHSLTGLFCCSLFPDVSFPPPFPRVLPTDLAVLWLFWLLEIRRLGVKVGAYCSSRIYCREEHAESRSLSLRQVNNRQLDQRLVHSAHTAAMASRSHLFLS